MKVFAGLFLVFLAGFLVTVDAGYRVCPEGPKTCVCTYQFEPVCSTIGCTYGNPCLMKCAGQKLHYRGKCRSQSSYYG